MRELARSLTYLLLLWGCAYGAEVDPLANPPSPFFAEQTQAPAPKQRFTVRVGVLLKGLQQPRSLVPLPDGNLLVTEGVGHVRVIRPDGSVSDPLPGMPPIRSVNGRSMNDFIADVNFAENRVVYFTYQAPPPGEDGGPVSAEAAARAAAAGEVFQLPRVARARLAEDLSRIDNVEIIGDYPGRRLASSPDGTLFITTMGHGEMRPEVQKLSALAGKVLRINSDGSIPENNPYYGRSLVKQEIYSYGHRDPDGAFIHPETAELWLVEHGPMGGDELNVIRPGNNYGWPIATYGKNYDGTEIAPSQRTGTQQPLYYWFPSVATSGLMMYTGNLFPQWQGNLFLGTMSPTQGKYLVRLVMDGEKVQAEEHLLSYRDRRVRAVAQGADGALYVLTDSEDNDQLGRRFSGEVLKLTPGE